ncbi:MAG: hypothetical protein ACE5F6_18395, partial [Anaerolineae bacterium]
MEVRPTNTSSRPAASHPQRRASFLRSLFVIAVGVALLSLALAVPISMAARANARSEAADISSRPSVDDSAGNQAAGALPDAMSAPRPDLPRSRSALLAGVVNGGFETGDLTNWTVGGSAAKVEVLQSSNFSTSAGPAPAPTEGNYFALLCSGPGVVNATSQGNIDGDGLATNDYDTSIMTTTLSLTAADVPATLSFDWSFLTDEGRNALDAFDDFFQVTLNGVRILDGSRPIGGVSLFPDVTGMDNVAYTVTGATNNCFFGDGRNSFQTFRTIISTPGSYTLVFLVADQGGADIDSGLLIDNVQLTPEIDLELLKTATPDPAVPGEPLTYEITVNNNGTGRATDVVVTDTLPSEVQYIVDTAGCDTTNLPVLACALGDMVGGTSKSFEIKVDVNSNAMATGALTITNTAVVDSLTPDRNLENNTVSLVTLLQDSADLRVVKMSKPDTSVRAGDLFTYTIFVDNLGPSHARNVVLTDTILSSGAFTLVSVDDDPNRTDSCTTSAISG